MNRSGPHCSSSQAVSSNANGVKRTWRRRYSEGSSVSSWRSPLRTCENERSAWSTFRSMPGTQVAPSSMAAPRSSGCRSKTPSSTMQARKRSGEWCTTGKSLDRRFSPPPSQSLGRGRPLLRERLGQELPTAHVEHFRGRRPRPDGPTPAPGPRARERSPRERRRRGPRWPTRRSRAPPRGSREPGRGR